MLLILQPGIDRERRQALERALSQARIEWAEIDRPGIEQGQLLQLRAGQLAKIALDEFPGVARVITTKKPYVRALRLPGEPRSVVHVGEHSIGGGELTLIAGPCAVEPDQDWDGLAQQIKRCGAHLLRGGGFKPRSSPYDFQGLGAEGLVRLADAGRKANLPIVTEAVDERSLEAVEAHAQMIQIGARNMQNYALLKRAGKSQLPVLLKRGLAASLDDWLLAAEYLLDAGNENVVLCERGIRTFSDHSRFTLDLSVLPRVQELSHLPVIVDPSHATGRRSSVAPLAKAGAAAGADGIMVEVHPEPSAALCDGAQALTPSDFERLAVQLRALASVRDAADEVLR